MEILADVCHNILIFVFPSADLLTRPFFEYEERTMSDISHERKLAFQPHPKRDCTSNLLFLTIFSLTVFRSFGATSELVKVVFPLQRFHFKTA